MVGWFVSCVGVGLMDGRPDFATPVIRTASVLKESCGITLKVNRLDSLY